MIFAVRFRELLWLNLSHQRSKSGKFFEKRLLMHWLPWLSAAVRPQSESIRIFLKGRSKKVLKTVTVHKLTEMLFSGAHGLRPH